MINTIYFVILEVIMQVMYFAILVCITLLMDSTKKVTLEEAKQLHTSFIIFGGGGILDTNSKMNNYYKSLNNSNTMFHWGSGSNFEYFKIQWKPGEDEIQFGKIF